MTRTRGRIAALLALGLAAVACSGGAEDDPDAAAVTAGSTSPPASSPGTTAPVAPDPAATTEAISTPTEESTTTTAGDDPVVAAFAGEPWFLGEVPSTATSADPSLPPVRLGMINQENTPFGSYPAIRAAAEAAAAWVNAELGGVGGRPVEVLPCVTGFDAERSRACAQQLIDDGVVAFVGGVDVLSEGAIAVIEQNELVLVGGIPANLTEQGSSHVFSFSGGDAAALAAFMSHAAETGRASVTIAYGDGVASFQAAARKYGLPVADSLGLTVEYVPFPLLTNEFEPVLTEAIGSDAVLVLAATTACLPVMQAAAELAPEAQLYLTGACAEPATITAAGDAAEGVIFNAEGPLEDTSIEAAIYQAVIDRYATEPAGGAGTVGFRGFMNLYALLLDAGPDDATSAAIIELARAAVDRPSFWGHPYTCDGDQVPGLPALCAPQQILFRTRSDGVEPVTDWIPVDEIFAAALG